MSAIKTFKYLETESLEKPSDSLVAVIPSEISNATQLFETLTTQLKLPNYFGSNWNALSDCLRDFHWVKQRNILITHQDLPQLAKADLVNYLEVLDECVRSWESGDDHRLIVTFPDRYRKNIEQLMSRKS
jgi:RNAse (barnase) inhibitor barstar